MTNDDEAVKLYAIKTLGVSITIRRFKIARITIIGLLAITLSFAAAAALDVGIGVFVSPGFVAGEASDVTRLSAGLAGRVSFGVTERLNVACGVGYNDFTYGREGLITIPEVDPVVSTPMLIVTAGADYNFLTAGALRPFVGGGAALAREHAEAYGHSTTDWYGGLYAEGGARYFLAGGLAVEAGPRYTLLFDELALAYDDFNVHGFVRSEHRSLLVELMVGVNYYF